MGKGKHEKPREMKIPRGAKDNACMTGVVTEKRKPVVTTMNRFLDVNDFEDYKESVSHAFNTVTNDTENLWRRVDEIRKAVKAVEISVLCIAVYLLIWLIGWGLGCW